MKGRAQTFKFGVVSSTLTFTCDVSYISSSKKNYARVVIRPYYEKEIEILTDKIRSCIFAAPKHYLEMYHKVVLINQCYLEFYRPTNLLQVFWFVITRIHQKRHFETKVIHLLFETRSATVFGFERQLFLGITVTIYFEICTNELVVLTQLTCAPGSSK